ncbi:MAG TPA: M3 family oligoendopeptidase [Pseudogracilibacillus sp.]|nr:M3 family oligoendopeptidase [Pseudogracilibacillus sp.]
MKYMDTWNLEDIFTGGTESKALQEKLQTVQQHINDYERELTEWDVIAHVHADDVIALLNQNETIVKGLGQAGTFVRMAYDAYMDDKHASVVMGQVMQINSELQKISNTFTKKLVAISDEAWEHLLTNEKLNTVSFRLNEMRKQGERLLSESEEKLIAELNPDGLAAWSELYDTTVSIMTIPFTDETGKTTDLSVGQAMNRMYADSDSEVRKQIFTNWEAAWTKYAPIFTDTLNHLAGYRLTLQKAHGRTHHLEEPLEYNRMTKDTLDAMWGAISNNKQPFINYLDRKAALLGMDKLAWQDVDAPIALGDFTPTTYTYDEACEFILKHFTFFGPKLTAFTKHALENRWVEAEDRPNKRPGGYCTSLPEWEESRIFMTFTKSPSDVSTLAHELGHAFHSDVLKEEPYLHQRYAMNVAETASTFAETIINNATVEEASSKTEKIALLGAKLEGATAMFLNIHARFLFEDAFYTERNKGIVSEHRLNELMEKAQKEAYGDSLASYHPHFWCSKLHFFIDSVPFYNFPYTFGYLFSLGIYAEYLKNPAGFEEKYIALLKDTGAMEVEALAKKHLNVDMSKEDFWQAGIEIMIADVEEFMRLTEEYV